MTVFVLLGQGLAASVAALGFAVVTKPPKSSFIFVPILAFIALVTRNLLWIHLGFEVAVATFFAALLVGFVGVYFAHKGRCPAEVYCFPSLLPMIPGIWAYKSLLGLIRFMDEAATFEPIKNSGVDFLPNIASNTIITCMVMFGLGVGVAIPLFLFSKSSFNMDQLFRA